MSSLNLAKIIEQIPSNGIDFEYCAVQQIEQKSFTISNPTNTLIQFEIQMDEVNKEDSNLFFISPLNGILKSGQKKDIIISFAPVEAKVIITSAVFKFQENDQIFKKVLKLSGIGKFPFVCLNLEKLDFELLTVGKSLEKQVEIKNYSQVKSNFSIESINDDGKDQAFQLSPNEGEINPGSSVKITVKYSPSIVSQYSCIQYNIKIKGGNELKLSCQGQANGTEVSLSTKSIHFGEVQIESTTNRLLNIQNDSDQPAIFQFFADKSNIFSFSKLEGVIEPKSQARIIIEFFPRQTKNYYERVFCVVRNHQVLYVDLIGTCFDVLTKPMPLMQRHVDIYRNKVIMGVHDKLRKDKFGEQINSIDTQKFESTAGLMDMEINQEIPIDDPSQVVLHKEMFSSAINENKDIQFSQDFIDFNFAESGRISESKQLTVTNKFPFFIDVNWALLNVLNKTTGQWVKNPFRVRPELQRIEQNSQFTFQVEFAPYQPDQYFFQIAQCFIELNNNGLSKNKRIIAQNLQREAKQKTQTITKTKTLLGSMKKSKYEEAINEDIDPTLCINIRMVGHSFAPGSQPFIPMVKLNPFNNIVFPSCGPNESVYNTVQISNTSDTPVYFKILQDSTMTFKTYPSVGLIPGKNFGIICIEFNPKMPREYNFQGQFIYNHNPQNIQKINFIGYCYEPSLKLSNDQKIFFPPIYKGVSSKQQITVKNQSRIPLMYQWKVPDKYKNEVKFNPVQAHLLPNEETKILVTFTTLKKKDYLINVPIYAQNIYDHVKNSLGYYNPGSGLMQKYNQSKQNIALQQSNFIKKYNLEIIGRGSDGVIQIKPGNVDFGTITVGFNKTMQATIYNRSNCNIFIELKMAPKSEKQGGKNKYTSKELSILTKVLNDNFQFDTPKGIINGKSKKTISITFKPQLRFDFDINLVCVAREHMDKDVQANIIQTKNYIENIVEKSFITVQAKGDYPLLRFEDVRNDQESIANLWERFNMTKMNKDLLNPLNDSEKIFNNSDQTNQSLDDLIRNLTVFNWDFGKIPIKYGSKPRKVTLTLKNIGGVEANWQFKLPNDSEIEMEPWADPGEPTPEKAFEKHILENKIFNVQPRSGKLQPGEQMELNVFYYPKEVKKHYLKSFLQIKNGKPLIINFQGETLHRRAYLRLLKEIYYMPPTPINLEWAVTYPIEIKNLGITKLKYQIDTSALEALNANNYDFKIFEIQNPEGTLAASDTQYIYTLFRPLEAKEYSVDLPIKISDIEGPSPHSHMLKLRCNGFHPEQEDIQNEVQFYEDLPKCRAYVGEEGQQAAFSYESIDFGSLEPGQISNRFVILYNNNQNQKLKFEFIKSGLMCGDNLKLEPMSGELEPNSHQNIKMTLIPQRFPTHFEGEIQCQIEWDSQGDEDRGEQKSMQTGTNINENQEFLFLRLKKRSKFTKDLKQIEAQENETLFTNVLNEMMNDILNDQEMDTLLDSCYDNNGVIFRQVVTSNQEAPTTEKLYYDLKEPSIDEYSIMNEQEVYKNNLKDLTGNDDDDIVRKSQFLNKKFSDMLEYMLEDTIFNLMEEATYEEFDLMQAPKIYIRKDQLNL